jgi:Glycosyltransferase family 87
LLSLPFSLLSYQQAATLWLFIELSCITISAYLLSGLFASKRNGASRLSLTLFLSILMLAWTPFMDELILGQLTSLLLLLFIGAWLSLRQDKDLKGGFLLGCAVAIKLIAWPVIAFLALKRRWRAVLSATAVMGLANLAAAWFIGLEGIAHYYLKVGPLVSALHRAQERNLSVWTIGWRLFEGTGSSILLGVKAPPLIYAPELARWVSLALPLAVLIIGLWLAYRARSFDFSFGILVCVSILISPVAWSVYFMLLVIPFLIGGRCLMDLAFPTRETIIVIGLLLIFSVSHSSLHNYLLWFAPGQPNGNIVTAPQVSWWVSMLALIPSACLLVLIYVLSQLSQKCTNEENYERRGEIS